MSCHAKTAEVLSSYEVIAERQCVCKIVQDKIPFVKQNKRAVIFLYTFYIVLLL